MDWAFGRFQWYFQWWSRVHTERERKRKREKETNTLAWIESSYCWNFTLFLRLPTPSSASELMALPLVIIIIIFYPNWAKVECQPSLLTAFLLLFFFFFFLCGKHSFPLNCPKSTTTPMSTTTKIEMATRTRIRKFVAKQRMVSRPTVFSFVGVCIYCMSLAKHCEHLRNAV